MNTSTNASGTEGVAAPTAPVVPNTWEGITTDTHATTARTADSTSCTQTGDGAHVDPYLARGNALAMTLLRAIVSTVAADRGRMLLATLAVWWHALAALATSHSTAALDVAREAYDAADEHGDATTCAALVAAFAGVDASTLYGMARDPREASEVRNMAREALPIIAALLAELDHVEGKRAPTEHVTADPREVFARTLLEYAAEHDVAALALVGAEVMFPDYAGCSDAMEVRKVVTAVCEHVTAPLTEAGRATRGTVDHLDAVERAGLALRDVARVIDAASHMLDASIATERARCEACK